MNIYELISRAQGLRQETKLDSVSPDRVGALCEDTLKYINEFQLLASSPSLHKIYVSVSAMQADAAPQSDLTGKALKPGQLVVIVPANQSDATAGDVYRYDGPSGNTSAWTFISKIGAVPADAELSATSENPVQNKVVTEKLTELESDLGSYGEEDNPEYIRAYTDKEGKFLWGIKHDGSIEWAKGIPQPIIRYIESLDKENDESIDKIEKDVLLLKSLFDIVDNEEYISATIDASGNMLMGFNAKNGKPIFPKNEMFDIIQNDEWLYCIQDSAEHIIAGIKKDGKIFLHKKEDSIKDLDHSFPCAIYDVWNDIEYKNISDWTDKEFTREYLNTLYADRLYANAKALFDGIAATKLLCNTIRHRVGLNENVFKQNLSVLLKDNVHKDVESNIELITTKASSSIGKSVTLMCIGDSITANNSGFWDRTGNWSYECFTKELFTLSDIDNAKDNAEERNKIQCHLIGTLQGFERVIEYRGETISHKNDCHEGRGGWAVCNYLRHPLDIFYDEADFNVLGLKSFLGEDFDGSARHLQLMANTCWGLYAPDITESVWLKYRGRIGLSNVSWDNVTTEQIAKLKKWITEDIVNNPINPFYDKASYNAVTNTMFSWDAYYRRYKSVENDGYTPLQEKGTHYVEGMNVCVPKFISIALGTNDGKYKRTQTEIVEDVMLLANLLKQSTNAKIIVINHAFPGSQIPEYFTNMALELDTYSKEKIKNTYYRNAEIMDTLGDLNIQKANGIFYCPTFFVQGYDASCTHRTISLDGDNEYNYSWNTGDVHPGCSAHKQIGYQLYSLIVYLLTD